MKSHPSKRYPLFAAFADYYLLSIIIVLIFSISSSLANKQFFTQGVALVVLLLIIISLFTYYIFIGKKIKFLTPGEKMIGGIIKDGKKVWMNPYGKKRSVLFIFIFIALIALGVDWGNASTAVFPLGVIIGKGIRFILVYPALIYLGMGRHRAALIPGIVFLLSTSIAMVFYLATKIDAFIILALLSGIVGLLAFYVYSKFGTKN